MTLPRTQMPKMITLQTNTDFIIGIVSRKIRYQSSTLRLKVITNTHDGMAKFLYEKLNGYQIYTIKEGERVVDQTIRGYKKSRIERIERPES